MSLTIQAVTLSTMLVASAVTYTRTAGGPTPPQSRAAQAPDDGLASFGRSLLKLYGVLAIGLVLLVAVEARAGMFDGLTTWEAILTATGTAQSGGVDAPLM
jgi:hypothetical protein